MSAWAAFAESDQRAAEAQPEVAEEQTEGKVEDMAVGKLRLWLRGVFGGGPPRDQ